MKIEDLNEIIDNTSTDTRERKHTGNSGKINVVKVSDGYNLEVKHKDGWFSVGLQSREYKTDE